MTLDSKVCFKKYQQLQQHEQIKLLINIYKVRRSISNLASYIMNSRVGELILAIQTKTHLVIYN